MPTYPQLFDFLCLASIAIRLKSARPWPTKLSELFDQETHRGLNEWRRSWLERDVASTRSPLHIIPISANGPPRHSPPQPRYVGTAHSQISKRYLGTDLDVEWRARG